VEKPDGLTLEAEHGERPVLLPARPSDSPSTVLALIEKMSHIYGVALLTGTGFTMSLFMGTLAFPAEAYDADVRVSVLLASVTSAICGYLVLRRASARRFA
jgi:Na+/H+ antiporter NhaA